MEMGGNDSALGVLRTKFDLRRKAQGLEGLLHLAIGTKFIEVMDSGCKGKPISPEIHTVATRF